MSGVHPLRKRKHRRGKRKRKVADPQLVAVPLPVAPSPALASLRQRLTLLNQRAS